MYRNLIQTVLDEKRWIKSVWHEYCPFNCGFKKGGIGSDLAVFELILREELKMPDM